MAGGYGGDGSKHSFFSGFGTYWSSELDIDSPADAYYLFIDTDSAGWDIAGRFPGQSVRAVT